MFAYAPASGAQALRVHTHEQEGASLQQLGMFVNPNECAPVACALKCLNLNFSLLIYAVCDASVQFSKLSAVI